MNTVETSSSSIAADVLDRAPEPTETPQSAGPQPGVTRDEIPLTAANPPPEVRDSLKRLFDAERFAVDESGNPRFDALGRFINRNAGRGGKKSPSIAARPLNIPKTPSNDAAGDSASVEAEGAPSVASPEIAAAEGICVLLYTVGAVFIGEDEWLPKKGEHETLRDPWAHYFRVTGTKEMPPWVAPALATMAFAQKRLAMPKTQTKIGLLKMWFARWRARREGRKIAEGLPASN